ncbi:unnamed protein product [Adineta ricciae]|uniref:NAD(P)(+)--arginine ADP-ribosyltransferase n=1 Tax=Adineta ricciae TaxID=249248 RepID=A0A815GER5_ADIRI|nr:unnamed protein product [Adineta ricciae]CAF1338778.1 unnamed protein product [Adineta ricciae]
MATHKIIPTRRESSREVRTIQDLLLIWLDSNIDEHDKGCQMTLAELRNVVNHLETYVNTDKCIEFIETIEDRRVFMIISGSLGQHALPRLQQQSQIDSIFIFCRNKQFHEQWAREWPQIKGVFIEINSICEILKQEVQQAKHNAVSMSFLGCDERSDQLEPSYMYTQILKEILLSIVYDDKHIKDYANYCYKIFDKNEKVMNDIKKFKRKYHQKTPIWWYTCESFLYPMLNDGIRFLDGDIMTRLGFFIKDLHQNIEKVHKKQQVAQTFTVYRGQKLSVDDFERLRRTKGGLMSFNSFLSTSTKREISLGFARQGLSNKNLLGILFTMEIDPKQSTVPFASISQLSNMPNENEVLFSMLNVFTVDEIRQIDGNHQLMEVHLTLTHDNDPDLTNLTRRIRAESFPLEKPWERLGLVLKKLGQYDKAEEIFRKLLDQTKTDNEKKRIYHQLALLKDKQGKYEDAIQLYEKVRVLHGRTLPDNHPDLAAYDNNIGLVYLNQGDYSKALSYHQKALANRQQSLPTNHPHLATSYDNIGIVYSAMNESTKALDHFEKALAIRQRILPSNHPDLGASYGNMGNVYYALQDYSKALSFYEKALEIKRKSLPPHHPDLAAINNNMGYVYENTNNQVKALVFFEQAVQISKKALPSNHPTREIYERNSERLKNKVYS